MYLANVLADPDYEPIKKPYEKWYGFMEDHIEFWLPGSELHTKAHTSRVLLLALLIGQRKNLSEKNLKKLGKAAVFHDSRRQDDGLDQGHGSRAADYFKGYCQEHDDLSFDEQVYNIIYYHDQRDNRGLSAMEKMDNGKEGMLLYQIFKDADGLDRLRLGPDALDVGMLRTEEARGLVQFVRELLQNKKE